MEYFPLYKEEFPEFADCDCCYDWKGGNALASEVSADMIAINAVTNDMFSDTTHLNGRESFTRFLAEEYGHLLRN